MTAAIWEISITDTGVSFWLDTGRRYVACRCSPDTLQRIERSTGLAGAAALRAVERELVEEANRRLAEHETLPLRLGFRSDGGNF